MVRKNSRYDRDFFPNLSLVSQSAAATVDGAMPDSLTKKGPRDAGRVNMHEAAEVEYWCKRIGCTRAQLIIAVHSVGPLVGDVRKFLGK